MTDYTGYLAYLAWFSVVTPGDQANLDIVKEDLERWFDELGLENGFLPRSAKAVDAFKQATSFRSEVYMGSDGLQYQLAAVRYKQDAETVARHVMRYGVSHDTKSVRVATITFYRPRRKSQGRVQGSEDVRYRLHAGLDGAEKARVQLFVDECLGRYEVSRQRLNPHKMRHILRSYLSYVGAVRQPGEDVYFVPLGGAEEIERLQTVIGRCGEDCRLTLVPLVDGPEYRAMFQEAIDVDVDTRARRTLQEITTWRDTHPGQTPGRLTIHGWMDELQGLQVQVLEFGDKYGMVFDGAADSLEELTTAVEALARRYVSGG